MTTQQKLIQKKLTFWNWGITFRTYPKLAASAAVPANTSMISKQLMRVKV